MQVKARSFGAGSPATGESAELTVLENSIEVRTSEVTQSVELTAIRVREVGTGQSGIEFAWETPQGARAVQVFDAGSVASLKAHASLQAMPQMRSLSKAQRRNAGIRALGWSLIAAFVLLPLLVVLLFIWQADNIAAAVAERISIAQETQLGEQAFAGMRGTLALVESGPQWQAVQSLGKRLSKDSAYRFQFYVAGNDIVNAYALPGGIVVVHTGLIQATRRPEELAGVLAHEIQHVEQRHGLQALVKDLGLKSLWILVTGDLGSTMVGRAALQLTTLKFSRDAELQADSRGFDELVRGGIDPGGMADFFSTMEQRAESSPPPILSTHPASEERRQMLSDRRAALREKRFAPLMPGPWPP